MVREVEVEELDTFYNGSLKERIFCCDIIIARPHVVRRHQVDYQVDEKKLMNTICVIIVVRLSYCFKGCHNPNFRKVTSTYYTVL